MISLVVNQSTHSPNSTTYKERSATSTTSRPRSDASRIQRGKAQSLHWKERDFKSRKVPLLGKGFISIDRQYLQRSQFTKRDISVALDLSPKTKEEENLSLAAFFWEQELLNSFAQTQDYSLKFALDISTPFLHQGQKRSFNLSCLLQKDKETAKKLCLASTDLELLWRVYASLLNKVRIFKDLRMTTATCEDLMRMRDGFGRAADKLLENLKIVKVVGEKIYNDEPDDEKRTLFR